VPQCPIASDATGQSERAQQTDKQTDTQTHVKACLHSQTDRQTDRQTEGEAYIEMCSYDRRKGGETDAEASER